MLLQYISLYPLIQFTI